MPFPWEIEEEKKKSVTRDRAAAAVRGASVNLAPGIIRLGTGIGSGLVSNVPLAGPVLGGALSGGGEILAQYLEKNKDEGLNWPRIGLETAIGAIPAAKLVKAGSVLKSAGLGAAAAGAGVIGRHATTNDPNEKWDSHIGSDLFNVVVGGIAGGAIGHYTSPKAPKVNTTPYGPDTIDETLSKGRWTKPEDINREAARWDAMDMPDQARGLRIAAAKQKKGDVTTYGAVTRDNKADILQMGRNENAAEKARINQQKAADDILSEAEKKATTAAKVTEKDWQQEARNLNARDKYLTGVAKEADKESLAIEKQRMSDWAQEAKNLNKAEEYNRAVENAAAVQRRIDELTEAGAKAETVVTQTSSKMGQEGSTKATTVLKTARKGRGGKGPASSAPAVAPKDGVFQIVTKEGKVVEATDEASALELVNSAGPGSTVVPPKGISTGPTKPVTPKPTKLRGSATKVVADMEKAGKLPPEAPPAVPVPTPTKPPITPAPVAAPLPAAGGTMADIKAAIGVKTSSAPFTSYQDQSIIGRPLPPTASPSASGGLKLSAPTAVRVAEASAAVPAGSTIARFFPNRSAAMKAAAYNENLPNEAIDTLNPLLGMAEASKAVGKASKNPNMQEAGGKLWQLIQQVGKESELPQFGRGAKVGPSMKLAKTPEGAPVPKPSVAATANPPKPAAPLTTVPSGMKIAQPVPAAPPAPLPDLVTGRPLPPELKIRIKAAQDQMAILEQAGKGGSPEADKLAKEIEGLQVEAFVKQFPDDAAELAQAEQAAKAPKAPKATKPKPQEPGPPRLVKKKGDKGTTLGMGLGGGQNILDIIRNNPQFTSQVLPTAAGAAVGASTDEDDPIRGAIIGGAAGAGLGAVGGHLTSGSKPLVSWDRTQPGNSLAKLASGFQRFNFLTNPLGLTYNTVLAPLGSGTLGSLERMAVGKAEQLTGASPNAVSKINEGIGGLKNLYDTYGPNIGKYLPEARREAAGLIGAAERAEMLPNESHSLIDDLFATPGVMMTTGDAMARGALQRGGLSEDAARAMTVSSNPRYKQLGEALVNLAKTGPVMQFLLPFSRTAANVAEGSLERTPLIGFFLNKTNDPNVKATMTEIITRQGMGGGVLMASYEMGKSVNPETDKQLRLRSLVSNMAGQYGLLAAAGFAAGQATQLGKAPTVGDKFYEGSKAITQGIPLPTTRSIEDIVRTGRNWLKGQAAHPEAPELSNRWVPYSLMPGFIPPLENAIRHPEQQKFPWEN